jgi:glycylpeptide N-tetradecanoyltransferase
LASFLYFRYFFIKCTGTLIPRPFTYATYWQRPINFVKLQEIGYVTVPNHLKIFENFIEKSEEYYSIENVFNYSNLKKIKSEGFRKLKKDDIKKCYTLFNDYIKKFRIVPLYTLEEFEHWIIPRKKIVYSYVIENNDKEIIDFVSFYNLPSSIINKNDKYDNITGAYLFYYSNLSSNLKIIVEDILYILKKVIIFIKIRKELIYYIA